jgi:hypothetical protein
MNTTARTLASLGFALCLAVVSSPATAASVLGVPLPSVRGLIGGGGAPGGGPGGPPAGGGGSASAGMPPGTTPVGVALNMQGAGPSMTDSNMSMSRGPDDRFGDPLSTDLFGNDKVHAHLRYYGETSGVGTTQAVGINFTFAQ